MSTLLSLTAAGTRRSITSKRAVPVGVSLGSGRFADKLVVGITDGVQRTHRVTVEIAATEPSPLARCREAHRDRSEPCSARSPQLPISLEPGFSSVSSSSSPLIARPNWWTSRVRIFLSYRRRDVGGYAGRLRDALAHELGEKNVFQDVEAIAPGQDFTQVIRRALDDCDAVLAVIGPGWVGADKDGAPRLGRPDDYVRLELATALTRDLPVVPVLLGGASMPAVDELPDGVKTLALRQAVVIRDESWRQDVEGLLRSLREEFRPSRARPRRRLLTTLAVVAVAVAGMLLWSTASDDGGGSADEQSKTVAPCVPPGGEAWTRLPIAQNPVGEWTSSNGTLAFRVRGASSRPIGPGRWQVTLETSMENRSPEERYHGDWHYDVLVVGQRVFEKTCFSGTPDLVIPGTVGDGLVSFEVGCEPAGYIELVLEQARARIGVTDAAEPAPC